MTTTPDRVETPRGDHVDRLHGADVADPYRWLEDGADPAVGAWVAAQNEATRAALDGQPSRARWSERLLAVMALPVVQQVQVRGEVLVVLERAAGADQARLVARSLAEPAAQPFLLVDPSAGTDDGAAAVDWYSASRDGSLVAFGVSEGGTENSVLHVVRTADGVLLDEAIPNCRAASVSWEPDGTGFFYTRYPEGDEYHRTVHHHAIGAAWADDPVVWAEHPTPETWPNVAVSPDGRRVRVDAQVGWSRTDHHVLDRVTGEWLTVIEGADAVHDFVFLDDDTLVGVTTLDAPRGRIVRVDLNGADGPAGWATVVSERDVVIGSPRHRSDQLAVVASRAGVDTIELWALDGSVRHEVRGPGLGSVVQLTTDPDPESDTMLSVLMSFDRPPAIWRVARDAAAAPVPVADDDAAAVPDLAVSQVEYTSPDGTSVGLFLIHREDVEPSSSTPTILNGYGGFAITESPVWSPTIAAWCESGGLYAIAGLRGGFEHGEEWHQAGRRQHKQNVFDDFHAAADWLVDTGRTSRARLAIAGGSNGGLLVGAALTQRPDLCRAVWCAVPLLDMIRFPNFLIARLWTDEYGDPDVAEEFGWLYAYSPYHNVSGGECYPAVLLTTAEGDSRVDPMHARKMAAQLQAATADPVGRPVLLHQEGRAGHGVGKPVGKRAAEQADVLAFFSWQLGFEP